jgi:hypothetical protein
VREELRGRSADPAEAVQEEVRRLVQRQEHGNQKPGEPLAWEDARIAVFYTALLMYEYDRQFNG